MKFPKLLESFNNAIQGIISTARTERNMKIHLVAALLVLVASFIFNVTKVEFLILAITVTSVIVAELFNTAVEAAIDMTTNYYHPLAKIAKNSAAGAVLIAAGNAVIVGYIIFWDRISTLTFRAMSQIKSTEPYAILIVIVMVCIITVIVKAIFGEGTPLKGGMPSGHSAISFALATAISLISESPAVVILSFVMAVITAQSRVDAEVHSIWEVIVGAILGILVTIFIFNLFKIDLSPIPIPGH